MLFRFPLSSRLGAAAVVLAAALWAAPAMFLAAPAWAETGSWVEPPAKLPKAQKGDPTKNLDFLFEALKIAPDDATAKAIEQRIWALWFVSRSDTADLLMSRAREAYEGKDIDLALKLLDAIVVIKPDYVEAWNRRATIYFLQKDYGKALADIGQVLRLEPRHFGALSGLGMILEEFGDDKHALEAYRRAAEVYPRMQRVPDQIKKLQEKVEGRDI